MTRRIRLPLALALAAALVLAPLAPLAHASVAPAPEPTSKVGVYAAIACGLGIKLCIAGGAANPQIVAVTLGVCALMIADALATPD